MIPIEIGAVIYCLLFLVFMVVMQYLLWAQDRKYLKLMAIGGIQEIRNKHRMINNNGRKKAAPPSIPKVPPKR